jgi:hypothetical protein
MKPLTDRRDFVQHSSTTVAGGFLSAETREPHARTAKSRFDGKGRGTTTGRVEARLRAASSRDDGKTRAACMGREMLLTLFSIPHNSNISSFLKF